MGWVQSALQAKTVTLQSSSSASLAHASALEHVTTDRYAPPKCPLSEDSHAEAAGLFS